MQKQRYNIALLPVSNKVNGAFYKLGGGLRDIADGYCLRPQEVLPHATLCQFRADNSEQASAIVQDFLGEKISIKIEDVYLNPGKGRHQGKFWFGFSVMRQDPLIQFQSNVHLAVNGAGGQTLTGTKDDYSPHFTLIRSNSVAVFSKTDLVKPPVLCGTVKCKAMLGLSDENGQFLKVIAQ